jgi:hypothetical protein
MSRRTANAEDLTIGSRCHKGNGRTEYVVISRVDDETYGAIWYTVAKVGSKTAQQAEATGQPQRGNAMYPLCTFTIEESSATG